MNQEEYEDMTSPECAMLRHIDADTCNGLLNSFESICNDMHVYIKSELEMFGIEAPEDPLNNIYEVIDWLQAGIDK